MTFDLEYNSERTLMIIPEYGRHIQKLVNHCVALETKEERNKMAKAIVDVMGNLQPHLRDVPDFKHKLWDQLFIMADFKLDVDSPYPQPSKEELQEAFNHIFCSYEKTPDESFDFRFELSRSLREEEWEKIPNMLVIYTAEDGTFEGDIKD